MRDFPISKFQDRLIQTQPLMAHTGLNELFIASEAITLRLSVLALRKLCEI